MVSEVIIIEGDFVSTKAAELGSECAGQISTERVQQLLTNFFGPEPEMEEEKIVFPF
jgi:hypothetical protein